MKISPKLAELDSYKCELSKEFDFGHFLRIIMLDPQKCDSFLD